MNKKPHKHMHTCMHYTKCTLPKNRIYELIVNIGGSDIIRTYICTHLLLLVPYKYTHIHNRMHLYTRQSSVCEWLKRRLMVLILGLNGKCQNRQTPFVAHCIWLYCIYLLTLSTCLCMHTWYFLWVCTRVLSHIWIIYMRIIFWKDGWSPIYRLHFVSIKSVRLFFFLSYHKFNIENF